MNANLSRRFLVHIILVGVLLATIVAYILPPAATIDNAEAAQVRLTLTVAMASGFAGSAVLFLAGLQSFKSSFRKAYRWFAFGMIIFGLAMLQWPVLVIRDLTTSFWPSSGAVVLPFICATALMYIGMRHFTRILGISTQLNSLLIGGMLVVDFALASAISANLFATNNTVGIGSETYTATVAWSMGFGILAWWLVLKINKVVGGEYRRPMGALAAALLALNIGGLHEYVTSFFLTESDPYVYWGISLIPFLISALFFIWAGQAFIALQFKGEKQPPKEDNNKAQAYIDSITEVAGLASRPAEIDSILDGVRRVTSSLQGNELSDDQQKTLIETYLKLENYLVENDPLRTFTKEQLRKRISPTLRNAVELPSSS